MESRAKALVNTVNTVGVMGKGIALQFKEAYPHNFNVYRKACKAGTFSTGQVLVVPDHDAFGERLIINFPTKAHWRSPSTYAFVETGLIALRHYLEENAVESIAIPPLGCGNGGLEWLRVKGIIEVQLAGLATEIHVYEPNEHIKTQLQATTADTALSLTPARAMLLYGLFHYETEGDTISLFVANKVAYFLQRLGQPMRLLFKKHFYGPYAPQMNSFVRVFNGSYLQGMEQGSAKPFEPLPLDYDRYPVLEAYVKTELNEEQQAILRRLDELLTGYKSAYPLEVLATVDWIRSESPDFTVAQIIAEAARWSSRKQQLLRQEHVELALEQLRIYEKSSLQDWLPSDAARPRFH